MRLNENYYTRLEEDICCCTHHECTCGKQPKTCGEKAKKAYEKYLEEEKCKPEPEVVFNICEYDPDQVYFLQYLSKRTLANKTLGRPLPKTPE